MKKNNTAALMPRPTTPPTTPPAIAPVFDPEELFLLSGVDEAVADDVADEDDDVSVDLGDDVFDVTTVTTDVTIVLLFKTVVSTVALDFELVVGFAESEFVDEVSEELPESELVPAAEVVAPAFV